MLAADVAEATEGAATWAGWWLFRRRTPPRPEAVAQRLADNTEAWAGPGQVRATDRHVVFEAGRFRRRASLRTVDGVTLAGRVLWVRRRRAHGWLVWFETGADAERLRDALAAGGAGR